ncbi:MAG: molybdenum cofactor guanylyltransferase [Desulfovibrionaceae bacterium]|nr:molybdenum cofactor guanylyltransferase [Desulfovibrionaceae bacterium]
MNTAGVILCGGLGTRMGGRNKAFLRIAGRPIIERLLEVYAGIFDEIVLAASDPEPYQGLGVKVAGDRYDLRSSLTGIHAGLSAVLAPHAFVAACDSPFLNPDLVRALVQMSAPDLDVVAPLLDNGHLHALCAVYSKRCLPHIEAQIKQRDFKIVRFFHKVKVLTVPAAVLRRADPNLLSFENVNTPEDLARAEARAALGQEP